MDTLWIGNGQLVLPQRVLENGSILIEDGRIVEIGYPCPQDVQRVDAEGGYILPGFIDLHVHGGGGADAMDATVQALKTMARTHAAHGTTALVPTTMTCEDALLERVIDRFLEARSAAFSGSKPYRPLCSSYTTPRMTLSPHRAMLRISCIPITSLQISIAHSFQNYVT